MEWARCEIVTAGVAEQPFDLVTAVLGVAIGSWLVRRDQPLVGAALVASGLASAAYHGTAHGFAGWLDALGVALVAFAFVVDARRPTPVVAAVGVAALAGLVAVDGLRLASTGLVIVAALGSVVVGHRLVRSWVTSAVVLFAIGVGAWWVGADESLCDPDGWFPMHALWHLCAVGGVAAAALARRPLAEVT